MLGTALPAGRVFLVEQPGPWGQAGLRQSRFDTAVAGRLETELSRQGIRVLAVRQPGRTPAGAPRHWGFADCRAGHETFVRGTFTEDADLLGFDPVGGRLASGAAGDVDREPLYLVCAHSKHDACCALRGRSVAAALNEVRRGRAWECSHLGGERFAANVLVLPLGQLYGRVLPFAAAEFAAATDRGEVVGALLRGRIGLKPPVQAALAFAHTHLAIARADAIRVVGIRVVDVAEAVVRLETPHGRMDVVVEIERAAPAQLTCHADRPAVALVHRPVSITQVD